MLITSKWVFGQAICDLHAFFNGLVIYVSPVTMGLTAINRYVRICKTNQQYRRLFSAKRSGALLVFVWIAVACYTVVPRLVGLQGYVFVPGYAQCSLAHFSENGKMIHYGIVLTLFFLTPLMATIISYIKVAKKIQQHNAETSSRIQRRVSAHEIKLSKSLFVVVFAFMICWIPLWVIVVLRRFHLIATMPRNVSLLCMFFPVFVPIQLIRFIYAGMNPVFRREFRKILVCERRIAGIGVVSGGGELNQKQRGPKSTECGVQIMKHCQK